MNRTPLPILLRLAPLLLGLACSVSAADPKPGEEIAPGVRWIARIADDRIVESSGVIASRRFPGVLWTHNDGGGVKKQILFAIDREGRTRAAFPVVGARFHDWEDIAVDAAGHLYLGDIGNNDTRRETLAVYRIDEPDPRNSGGPVTVRLMWRLRFPGAPFNSEGLFVWKDCGYLVSKVYGDARAQIFRFPLKQSNMPVTLELVATTSIRSPVTGADISADGRLLGLVAKNGAYVFRIDGDIARAGTVQPHHTRCKDEHIEGCCFVPGGLLATSERRNIFLFTDPAFLGK